MKIFDGSLYLVIDRSMILQKSFEEFLISAVSGGVTTVQLREKTCSTREYIDLTKKSIEILKPFDVSVLVNDRVDVVLASKAHGVHLGQSDFPFLDARQALGKDAIIGVTVESMKQVLELQNQDVDYLGVSSVFPTSTKLDISYVWGIDGISTLRKQTRHTLIAIGGINLSNSIQVMRAGADGLAVTSAICQSKDPYKASADLIQSIIKTRVSNPFKEFRR